MNIKDKDLLNEDVEASEETEEEICDACMIHYSNEK